MMKFKVLIINIISVFILSSCAKENSFTLGEEQSPEQETKSEIFLNVSGSRGTKSQTRTSLGADGESVNWEIGDQLALWADGVTNGHSILAAQMFQLKHFSMESYSTAAFAANISPMEDDQLYEYVAFYPYTSTIASKQFSYTLPQTQNGAYDGSLDFRVSDKIVQGKALSSNPFEAPTLEFRSLVHALRISIPEGYCQSEADIVRLDVEMPEGINIVGTLAMDMRKIGLTPSLSNGSNKVTLELENPIGEGRGEAWLFMNPHSAVSGAIKIKPYTSDNKTADPYTIQLDDHSFAAGHITPVNTEVKVPYELTRIEITLAGIDNLGEPIEQVEFVAPEGVEFLESNSSTAKVDVNEQGKAVFTYDGKVYGALMSGREHALNLESVHALVPQTLEVPENPSTFLSKNYTVPYLLNEDFSTLDSFSSNDNPDVGGVVLAGGDKDVIDLSTQGLTTTGWTATRVGSDGDALRIACRYQSGGDGILEALDFFGRIIEGFVPATTADNGRVDSPPLSYLKEGVTAKVKISFNHKGGRYSKYNTKLARVFIPLFWSNGGSKENGGNTIYSYGWTDSPKAHAGSEGIDRIAEENVTVADTGISNSSSKQDYKDIDQSVTFEIEEATNKTRASWSVSTSCKDEYTYGVNGNYWLYLDDIKAEIVP